LNNRLPAHFQFDRYDISPDDVVRGTLGCEPNTIRPKVVVMPNWSVDIFTDVATDITEIVQGSVYQLEYQGQLISVVRSGIGAPQTGDVILALAGTTCEELVFTGSVGGLGGGIQIGDLVVVEKSFCGDGFSRYLDEEVTPGDCFLQPSEPDRDLTERIQTRALETCRGRSVPLYRGAVFSTDSILAQFFRLDYLVNELQCIGVEMETAAVFRAAKLVGIRAGALLQVSDLPRQGRSLYAGRTEEEMERRRSIRTEVLAQVVLSSVSAS
jgi:purine-nucleoside phosphorylase